MASNPRHTDWSISTLRFVAMLCIVACHICQLYGLAAAWVLNVGVQVFLVISGWLYGLHANFTDTNRWYGRRLVRIVVPYWLVLIPLLMADALLTAHVPTMKQVILSVTCVRSGLVPNGAHLWYVSAILLCYLVTPLLGWLWSRWRFWPIVLFSAILFAVGNRLVAEGMWCCCYVMAFGVGRLVRDGVPEVHALSGVAIICSVGCVVSGAISGMIAISPYYLLHLFGGFLSFSLGKLAARSNPIVPGGCVERILKWSDKYSYEVYLTHQLLILGDFSLEIIFPENHVAVIVLAIAWSLTASFVLHQISDLAYRVTGVERG